MSKNEIIYTNLITIMEEGIPVPHVQINRVPIYYELSGTGNINIVFIHGMGLSHTNWMDQIPCLSKNAKVLTYDLRGHGRSGCSFRVLNGKDYMDTLVSDLKELLDHIKMERVFLVGYSTGCLIALQFMLLYPERVWGAALSGAYAKVSNVYLYTKLAGSLLLGELHFKKWLSRQVARSNGATEEQIQHFQYEAQKVRWKESHQLIRSSLSFDILDKLSSIQTPILLIYGGNERHMMKYRHQFLLALPHVEIGLVPKTNHACPTKGKLIFNKLIQDFIEAHRPDDIHRLPALHPNQNKSDAQQNPEDLTEGYPIGQAYQADRGRGNEDHWAH